MSSRPKEHYSGSHGRMFSAPMPDVEYRTLAGKGIPVGYTGRAGRCVGFAARTRDIVGDAGTNVRLHDSLSACDFVQNSRFQIAVVNSRLGVSSSVR